MLSRMGLGDDAIIAKIESEKTVFDLTTDQMIELKSKGVSSNVIASMLSTGANATPQYSMDSPDPNVPHPAGVYLLTGSGADARMQRMNATVSSQAKTGGIFGYALTGGLASASVKVAIQDETSPVQATTKPVFYFFFDQARDQAASNAWASGANTSVQSPAEFTLVELDKKKGRREARVGSMNIAGAKSGVMDKDRISFHYEMVRPGVYEVKADSVMEPGEYGFIFSLGGGGTAGAMTARIFDFSVR
ncbi:hypothetical protein GCM10010990_36530 [Croceicoccus mobilis]|uniref:Uncharacterized protein n=2 Tax=Croceicoccus mobilis TaxID=1703339 RepID=A0A916ZAD6_9SPHN|nr:hypothetical protein GCM10010990_36530 [Croceicoccus mobilis]